MFDFRFGMISALKALRPIKKEEEIFAMYRYPFLQSPTWYMKTFLQFIEENPDQFEKLDFVTQRHTFEELKTFYNKVLESESRDFNK